MTRARFSALLLLALAAAAAATAGSGRLSDEQLLALLDPTKPGDASILEAREAVERDGTADAYVDLGNAYRAGTFTVEAREAFEKATEVDPEHTWAWNNLGVMMSFAGDRKGAARAFGRAIETDPRNAEARYNLAHMLLRSGDFDSAVGEMKAVLLLRPELGDGRFNPRSSRSQLILPSRLQLYRDTLGGGTLGTVEADGSSSHARYDLTPWLGIDPPEPVAAAPPVYQDPAPSAPAAEPIVLGPESTGPAAAPKGPPPKTIERAGRKLQRGGPVRPKG